MCLGFVVASQRVGATESRDARPMSSAPPDDGLREAIQSFDEEVTGLLRRYALRNDMLFLLRSQLRLAVADAIDGAVPVVGDQDRTVLHLQHIDRAAEIVVVFQEARD